MDASRYEWQHPLPAVLRAALVAAMAVAGAATPVRARENILILIADDLGVDKVGAYGEGTDIPPTPVIDGLAAEGILFRNAYSNPWCTATRASTLTGRYGFRTGLGWTVGALDPAEITIPEILSATHLNAAVGKWHCGFTEEHPIQSGFTYYAGGLVGFHDYYLWDKLVNSTTTEAYTETVTTYATTDTANEAIGKIAEFGEDPWLLWVAFNAPHTPHHVPPAHLTTLQVDESSPVRVKHKAMVEAMDTEVGRILASISPGVLADTTIVFFGDNGTKGGVINPPFIGNRAKGTVYEGGVNVPLVVRSPWISPQHEGSETQALVNVSDVLATVAEVVGVPAQAEDSVSFLPYLQNPSLSTLPTRPYVYSEAFNYDPQPGAIFDKRALRDGRYKVIWRDGVYEEFFDLVADPWEQDNLLVSGMTSEENVAYDALVLAVEQLHDPNSTACDNGLDDDGDGRIDWGGGLGGALADPGCIYPAGLLENPECQDGINNDGRLGTDFDGGESVLGVGNGDPAGPDPQCTYAWQVREARIRPLQPCGLGFELALLLPPLVCLHRKRRRTRI